MDLCNILGVATKFVCGSPVSRSCELSARGSRDSLYFVVLGALEYRGNEAKTTEAPYTPVPPEGESLAFWTTGCFAKWSPTALSPSNVLFCAV